MRQVSVKRARLNREYTRLRAVFLLSRPWCEFPDCWLPASEVHHKRGRVGALYLDVAHWLPICTEHHRWVTEHPQAAYDMGLSERRVTQ